MVPDANVATFVTITRKEGEPVPRLARYLAITAVTTLAATWLTGCTGPPVQSDPGKPAAEAYASAFVAALKADDAAALAKVIDHPVSSTEVSQRLELYGGIQDTSVAVSTEFPRIYSVDVEGKDKNGQPVHIHQVVEWSTDHWFSSVLPSPSPS